MQAMEFLYAPKAWGSLEVALTIILVRHATEYRILFTRKSLHKRQLNDIWLANYMQTRLNKLHYKWFYSSDILRVLFDLLKNGIKLSTIHSVWFSNSKEKLVLTLKHGTRKFIALGDGAEFPY